MNYKKIIKSQNMRFKILNLFSWVPDKIMIELQYKIKMGKRLNLDNPVKFTEKIQWYKLYYRNKLMNTCVDKYEVRNYIKKIGLENILNDLYGVYDSADEIEFENLPNKFVIKTTSGSGGQNVYVCEDKNKIDVEDVKKKLTYWLTLNPKKSFGREWAYENTVNKIVIEKYLSGNNENLSGINDYKFFCFDGKVEYIVFDGDRYIQHKRNFYTKTWEFIPIESDCCSFGDIIPKPKQLDEMIKIAEKISNKFPFVRVDLYNIKNKIIFGEMTFYPWTGYVKFNPEEFDVEMGNKFKLPQKKSGEDKNDYKNS